MRPDNVHAFPPEVVHVDEDPSMIDGWVSRLVALKDSSGRIETWVVGKGWVPAGADVNVASFIEASRAKPEHMASLGIPPEDW